MKRKVGTTLFIIIAVMLLSFIIPKTVKADETIEIEGIKGGGSLLEPISQFLCYIFDAIIEFLQNMFVTPEKIKLDDGNYSIKYSPGIIFSGEVPLFDINFIDPMETKVASKTQKKYASLINSLDLNGANKVFEQQYAGFGFKNLFITKNGTIRDIKKDKKYEYDETREIDIELLEGKLQSIQSENTVIPFAGSTWNGETNTLECAWYNEDESKMYIIVDYFMLEQNTTITGTFTHSVGIIYLYEINMPKDLNDVTNITGEEVEIVYSKEYDSSSGILQHIVATWYNALRRIALVGLLSVIVYIGIRIVLTSTSAKDKAKYKKMLKDWLVALCLLFTLHYIMSITITIVGKINEVIKASSIAANGEDILMTSVRNKIANGQEWDVVLTYVVIYAVLAIFILKYTVQYIKRVVYIAFLTMIAPLITLTYPLDKIKDSKAQAFDMWIKDYVFFSLIQVVHLLIYYIFLGSAIDLADKGHWVYAIVAIGFITPAENLIKKMFGFEKSKTLGAMAAGATGALVVNALQGLSKGTQKENSSDDGKTSKDEAPKPVRTAGANPFVNITEKTSSNTRRGLSSPEGASGNNDLGNDTDSQTSQTSNTGKESKLAKLLKNNNLLNNEALTSFGLKAKRNINGVKAVAKKYTTPIAIGTIRAMAKTTGAVLGFSAAVAKGGNMSDIVSSTALGAKSVEGIANVTINGVKKVGEIPEKIDEVVDTYREGAYGKEVAQNAKFDRIFRSSRDYEELKKESGFTGGEFEQKLQQILNAGITDPKRMKKIFKNHRFDPKKYSMENSIKFSQLADQCSKDVLNDEVKFIRFCQDKKIGLSEEELKKLRKDIINFK